MGVPEVTSWSREGTDALQWYELRGFAAQLGGTFLATNPVTDETFEVIVTDVDALTGTFRATTTGAPLKGTTITAMKRRLAAG